MFKSIANFFRPGVRNAAPCMSPGEGQPGYDSGLRSLPSLPVWNAGILKPGMNRHRVSVARALDEIFPLCSYLNKMIPEEALGDGMVVSSLSDDDEFRRKANKLFDLWGSSNKIDVRGDVNIYTAQPMLGYYVARDGEIFASKIKSNKAEDFEKSLTDKNFRALQLQFIRRDQIGTSYGGAPLAPLLDQNVERWDDGILLNDLDAARKFRILRRNTGDLNAAQFFDVPASQMIHIREPGLEGIHGQPLCFRGINTCIDALNLRALSQHADKIRASFLGVISTTGGDVPRSMRDNVKPGSKIKIDEQTGDKTVVEDKAMRYYKIADGVFMPVLKKDESISFFNGQTGLTFGEQLITLAREILLAYMIPPEYVLQVKELGSAGARLILRKIKKVLNRARRPFADVFLQQVWEFVIGDAMLPHPILDASGKVVRVIPPALPMVNDWNVIQCKAAPDPSIDAGRDENAEQERIRSFTGTVAGYCDALMQDGEAVRHARLDEIADNIKYGESKHGLPWFLCVDYKVLQSLGGLSNVLSPDMSAIENLLKAAPKD